MKFKDCRGYIALIIAIVLGILLIYQLWNRPVKTENNIADIITLDKAPPKVYKDDGGKTHVEKEVIIVSDKIAEALYKSQIDTLKKQLNVEKSKNVKGVLTASSKGDITLHPKYQFVVDSVKKTASMSFGVKSKWVDVEGDSKTGQLKISQRDSITVGFIEKPYGLFNLKSRQLVDIHSANEHMKYYNVKYWQVPDTKNNKSKIGFGITVGYGLQLSKNNNVSHGLQATGGLQFRF